MMRQPTSWRDKAPVLAAFFALALILAGLIDTGVAGAAAHEPRFLREIGIFISRFGLSGYMLVISVLLVFGSALAKSKGVRAIGGISLTDLGERAAYFFFVIAASGLICQALKHIIGRARPKFLAEFGAFHFEGLTLRPAIDSFPSGHTTTVFAAALAFSLLFPRGRAVFYAFAILVGVARILAIAHFPSDVVGGAALGTIVALWITDIFAARAIAFSSQTFGIVLKCDRPHGTQKQA